jgi:hypothetical protein
MEKSILTCVSPQCSHTQISSISRSTQQCLLDTRRIPAFPLVAEYSRIMGGPIKPNALLAMQKPIPSLCHEHMIYIVY